MNNDVINLGTEAIEANSVIRERISRAKTVIKNELDEYGRRAKILRDISRAKTSAERRNDRKMSEKTEACLRAVSHEYDDCYRAASESHDRLCRYIAILEKDWNKLILQVGILDSKSAPREQNEFYKFKRALDTEKDRYDDLLIGEGIELGNYTKATVVESSMPEPVYKAPTADVSALAESPKQSKEEQTQSAPAEAPAPAPETKSVNIAPVSVDISAYVERAVRQTVDKMAALIDRRIEEYLKDYKPTVPDELVAKIADEVKAAVAIAPRAVTAPVSENAPEAENASALLCAKPDGEAAENADKTAPVAVSEPEASLEASAQKNESAPADSAVIEEKSALASAPITLTSECEAIAEKIADDEKFLLDKLIAIIEEIKLLNNDMAGVAAAYSEIESKFREIAEMQRVTNDMQRHTLREQQGIQVSQKVINKDQLSVAEEQLVLSDTQKKSTEEQKRVSAAQNAVADNQRAVAETQASIEEAMKAVMQEQKRIIAAQQQIVNENAKQLDANVKISEQQAELAEEQKNMLSSQKSVLKDQKNAAERQRETADAQKALIEDIKQNSKASAKVK